MSTVYVLIAAQYLMDTQAPPATNISHLLKDKFMPKAW